MHLDCARPIENRTILMAVDLYSKWIYAMVVPSSISNVTSEQLRMIFAEHGVSETIVTDNAICFTSAEFRLFVENCIQHITSPAYHPFSNGLAERVVQFVKRGLDKMKDGSIETSLARYLTCC